MKTIEQNDMISSEKDSSKEKRSKTERLLFLLAIFYVIGYAMAFWANVKSVSFIGAAESTANYLLIITISKLLRYIAVIVTLELLAVHFLSSYKNNKAYLASLDEEDKRIAEMEDSWAKQVAELKCQNERKANKKFWLLIIPFILITALVIGIVINSIYKKNVYFPEAGKLTEIYRDISENEILTVSNIEKISFYDDTKGYINYMICIDENGEEYRFPIGGQDLKKLFDEKCKHTEKGFRAEYLNNSHIITDYTFEASAETQG
ncbi:hypothetical protein [Ruminococcus albus]|uniref:Uncharacterized protein n=1 Tax=Ruminococcus albus TaxID=1264 RepID=A0A1H7NHZ0_RUMAL|nr:hypothetical protein [Ruminococcus albus]SEL23116.1 hypothetical protein SAMN05216469_11565 [Ruminococcus albus]